MVHATELPWEQIELLVRRDPAGRGVAAARVDGALHCEGHLALAGRHLASSATAVAIVTGFVTVDCATVRPESDGPPGALYLARALGELGIPVTLIADSYTLPVLQAGGDLLGLPRQAIVEIPFDSGPPDAPPRNTNEPHPDSITDRWVAEFLSGPMGSRLSHLIAVERPGPSHTEQSLAAQQRAGLAPLDRFRGAVPPHRRNVCFSMRGQSITGFTAKTHRLFEIARQRRLPITTIGIGDGGNEIGLGSVPWETLREAILLGPRDWLPCRIATDFTILAGVSNWGAYALALALAAQRGRLDLAASWTIDNQRSLLEHLVRETGVVDGVTLRREPTVDGLPQTTYLEILAGLRELVGLKP